LHPSCGFWKLSIREAVGRRFDVRRFESGNRTRTTSPRWQFIVDSHFWSIPVLGKRSQAAPQVGGLRLADPTFAEFELPVAVDPFD
jgi:hypothetical protein